MSSQPAIRLSAPGLIYQPKGARNYVQDGLVAMWDGIENAGWGVHDNSATTWKDLISEKSLLVANGMTWSDSALVTNKKNIQADQGKSTIPATINTVEIVFSKEGSGEFVCEVRNSDSGGGACGFIIQNLSLKPFWPYGNHFDVFSITADRVHSCSVMQAASGGTKYLTFDGVTRTYTSSSVYRPPYDYRIGNWYNKGTGSIYSLRAYSRALTADEIAHNYAIDKLRFNLPDS